MKYLKIIVNGYTRYARIDLCMIRKDFRLALDQWRYIFTNPQRQWNCSLGTSCLHPGVVIRRYLSYWPLFQRHFLIK
ncbi:MAG: hypothetical protein IPP42_06045 [Saprospiraceae bacterium]|nr:hypothetical protein [Saprospiraceae bacterium]